MPKIAAASVAEHRAQVQARLVDAAEALIRAGEPLTAGAVTEQAGIARNSIYRYVDSVDGLRILVVERYLPAWISAVTAATADRAPADAVVGWVEANLDQAHTSGHTWFAAAARAGSDSAAADEQADRAHASVRGPLLDAWSALLPSQDEVRVAVALTVGILDAGFGQLDEPVPYDTVRSMTSAAACSLVTSLYAP